MRVECHPPVQGRESVGCVNSKPLFFGESGQFGKKIRMICFGSIGFSGEIVKTGFMVVDHVFWSTFISFP